MLEKLAGIKTKYDSLTESLANPDMVKDQNLYTKTMKEISSLEDIVKKYEQYKALNEDLTDN